MFEPEQVEKGRKRPRRSLDQGGCGANLLIAKDICVSILYLLEA